MNFQNELQKYYADVLSLAVIKNYQIVEMVVEGANIKLNTKFQAASISKMIFTFAILRLVYDGELSLNDDVNNYLGNCSLVRRDGTKGKATIQQILTHTAGINVHGFDGYPVGANLPTTSQIIAGELPCNLPKIYQKYIPGEHWNYSGGGFMILQKCVENITKMDFADFMDCYVLSPLNMLDSSFRQDLIENLANGYTKNFKRILGGHKLMLEQAAAVLWTTALDMAKFGLHIQNILIWFNFKRTCEKNDYSKV